jgi:hypothetical protein
VPCEALPRQFEHRGGNRPYIRDWFDAGCEGLGETDIVAASNADVMVRGDLCLKLAACLQESNALYTYRRDFHHRIESAPPDADFIKGNDYPGTDLVAFRAGWWRRWRLQLPDFVLGYEAWDPCFRLLVDQTNPGATTCLRDCIAHERHGGPSHWEHPANRYSWRGQKYNLMLAASFLRRNGVNPRVHGIRV